jgi:hypothetical protein
MEWGVPLSVHGSALCDWNFSLGTGYLTFQFLRSILEEFPSGRGHWLLARLGHGIRADDSHSFYVPGSERQLAIGKVLREDSRQRGFDSASI